MTELQELESFLMDDMAHYHYFAALKRHLTRGGFIKDRNGNWCKEGDKVKQKEWSREVEGVLVFNPFGNVAEWRIKLNSPISKEEQYTECVFTKAFELIEPCEPDVCKDFKGYGE